MRLRRLLEKQEDVKIVAEAASGVEVLKAVREERPKLVFLDIQMPPPTGLEAAEEILDRDDPPLVVFLTAYGEHAVDAFELQALDYLVKPVKLERLNRCLTRVRSAAADRWSAEETEVENPDHLALKDEQSEAKVIVSPDDIIFFTSRDEKTYAKLAGRELTIGTTLTKLQSTLSPQMFLRTHRAYIVNLQKVKEVHPWFHRSFNLAMADGSEVPLSRSYVPAFRQRVNWF